MGEIFKYLQKLPPAASILAIILVIILLIIFKWESITKFIKLSKKSRKSSPRTCGDCVLILSGIREKYEYKARRLDTNLLRMQMKFAEQKIQEVIFFLSQSFNEDIKILGDGADHEKKALESSLYCEALKNGMLSVKDELRRSFKENGFGEFSENEFSYYVKSKTTTMLTIVRTYLNQHYIDSENTVVHLKERFEKMDKFHNQKFEGWAFDVFSNAKDLRDDTIQKKGGIEVNLKSEIDEFIKKESNGPSY